MFRYIVLPVEYMHLIASYGIGERIIYDMYKTGWLGRTARVLYETSRDGFTAGHTSEYLPVRVSGIHPAGEMAEVLISELQDHQLYGKAVNQSES